MGARRKANRRAMRRPKVFISHTSKDYKRASRLGALLGANGIDYWFSREHVVRGQDWYRAIGEALATCNWLVVVATPAAIRNKWVRDEVTYALITRRYKNRVIPLLFENCNLDRLAWSLQNKQHIDFRRRWMRASKELVARIR